MIARWLSDAQPGGLREMAALPAPARLAAFSALAALLAILVFAPCAGAETPAGTELAFDGGLWFTCSIKGNQSVACWGINDYGQAPASPLPATANATQVSAGGYHACAVKENRAVECWGSNTMPITCAGCPPDYPIETNQAKAPGGDFLQVSAGAYHTCGVKAGGSIDCWGFNGWGEADDHAGDFLQVSTGPHFTCAIKKANTNATSGRVECWGEGAYGRLKPPDYDFSQIAVGENHGCGILVDGNVRCWGGNTWGQAPNTRTGPYEQIAAGDLFTCALRTDKTLDCWGYNYYGQEKPPPGMWTTFGLGDAHGCANNSTTGAWQCWGHNNKDQAPRNPLAPPQGGSPESVAPVVQIVLTPPEPDGENGWYRTSVVVDPQASDDSGIAELRCVLDPPVAPAAFDALPPEPCPFLGGAAVKSDGEHTFYAAAMDPWGNKSDVVSASFKIAGFYPPVEPPPALNQVKAGQAVPLKFSLGADRGLDVIAEGFPVSQQVNCATRAPVGGPAAAGQPGRRGLSYDPESGWYNYVWKTDKAWGGTCRLLTLKLIDGTEHSAHFQFK